MIKQIINPSQIVQTGLAVEVDGIRVDYRRIPGKFAYEFTVSLLINETLDLNLIEDSRTGEYTSTVYFRIKDSY